MINKIIDIEGGYVNDPDDSGGETKYGITKAVARENGYQGDMRDLPRSKAEEIYRNQFYYQQHYNRIDDDMVAFEVFEQGINMGNHEANTNLQKAYNILNLDTIVVDGVIGPQTLKAVNRYPYQIDLYKALNIFQGIFYIGLAQNNDKHKSFIRGWLRKRVRLENNKF
jgi:lysozyme family protein